MHQKILWSHLNSNVGIEELVDSSDTKWRAIIEMRVNLSAYFWSYDNLESVVKKLSPFSQVFAYENRGGKSTIFVPSILMPYEYFRNVNIECNCDVSSRKRELDLFGGITIVHSECTIIEPNSICKVVGFFAKTIHSL